MKKIFVYLIMLLIFNQVICIDVDEGTFISGLSGYQSDSDSDVSDIDPTIYPECCICFSRITFLQVSIDGKNKFGCTDEHIFHESCLNDWLKNNFGCPKCYLNRIGS